MRLQTSWLTGRCRGGGHAVSRPFLVLAPLLALVLSAGVWVAAAEEPAPRLVVLCDDNYPPYVFRDSSGRLQGIVPDQWALWERQTGMAVEVRGMPWSEALRRMQAGQGDVIDTIFFSARRARSFRFTKPYARIEVSVFTHRSLGTIDDVRSLRGLTVGVKAGDVVVERLRNQGVDGLRIYPSYEAIILAAKEDGLLAFCVDRPPAIHYLYKHEISHEFREGFVFTVGAFHRAVRQGQPDLLERVQRGFDRIPRRDYEAVERRWRSAPLRFGPLLSQWWRWIVGIAVGVLALLLGNVILGSRVRARTQDLRQAMEDLRQSLDAQTAADAELRASREYLATVLDAVNDAVFIHDGQTGLILDVNRRACEMYGVAGREQMVGQTVAAGSLGVQPYTAEEAWRRMQLARAESPQVFDWQARRLDGSLFWVEVSVRHAWIGAAERFVVSVRDISERHRAEAERGRFREQLAHAQRLESIGRLAGSVAHDFNNSLQIILGYVDILLGDLTPEQPMHAEIAAIRKAVLRSTHLTRQLQALARRQAATPQRLDVNAALSGLIPLITRLIGEVIQVTWSPGQDVGEVLIDPGQLDQVIVNLCTNARDAVGPTGQIHLSSAAVDLAPGQARLIDDMPPGRYVQITVRDNGPGIPPEVLEHVFEPFFTTKPAGKGTGLGLAIVYGIVKQNGGGVHVDTAPGEGTAFAVYLPQQPSPAPSDGASGGTAPA